MRGAPPPPYSASPAGAPKGCHNCGQAHVIKLCPHPPLCNAYQTNSCMRGQGCRFAHMLQSQMPILPPAGNGGTMRAWRPPAPGRPSYPPPGVQPFALPPPPQVLALRNSSPASSGGGARPGGGIKELEATLRPIARKHGCGDACMYTSESTGPCKFDEEKCRKICGVPTLSHDPAKQLSKAARLEFAAHPTTKSILHAQTGNLGYRKIFDKHADFLKKTDE
jgi:hypothetical protein